MKRLAKVVCVMAMLITLTVAVCGCGDQAKRPSGTYGDGQVATMTFEGKNVSLKFGQLSASGTYKMDGNKIIVTFDGYEDPKNYTYDAEKDTITGEGGNVMTFQY